MSRSYKKRPFFSIVGADDGQSWWKNQYNRNMRRQTKMICHELSKGKIDFDEVIFPVIDEGLGDVYNSPKDGTNSYWSLAQAIIDDMRWNSWCYIMGFRDNSKYNNRTYVQDWYRGKRK